VSFIAPVVVVVVVVAVVVMAPFPKLVNFFRWLINYSNQEGG